MKNIMIFTALLFVSCSIHDDRLSTKISKEIEDKKEINLSELNDFEWSSMLILPPYKPLEKVADEHQLDLSEVYSHISNSDAINVILFLKERKAVKSCTLIRTLGDFQDINKEIAKSNANFRVIVDSLGNNLNQIVYKN